jgi:hypothetical protein
MDGDPVKILKIDDKSYLKAGQINSFDWTQQNYPLCQIGGPIREENINKL